ncbi:MAG: RluA family pseudouridine synthase [Burkholderiales bacterium]
MPEALTILHTDDTLVVISKPAGLLSVPGRGPERADCAAARVQALVADALVVHRLDQATSGLLLFARGIEAQRRLSAAFEKRRVGKQYIAVVAGEPAEAEGRIELPLMADWPQRPRQKVDHEQGKPALTHWHRLGPGPISGTTRLALTPVTGRSHQLRVHLAAIGHTIVGDELYAPAAWHAAAPRLLLHAQRLAFDHPVSGAALVFEDPAPF